MKVKKSLFVVFFTIALVSLANAQSPGDVNGDGDINIIDALVVTQYIIGYNPRPFYPEAADVTGCDGIIDLQDVLLIANYAAGYATSFPCASLPGNFLINYTLSGGFTGKTDTIVVMASENLIKFNDRRGELRDKDIQRIEDTLLAIDFTALPGDSAPCCCDMYAFELLIASDHPGISGSACWSSCTEMDNRVPEPVLALKRLLTDLASRIR